MNPFSPSFSTISKIGRRISQSLADALTSILPTVPLSQNEVTTCRQTRSQAVLRDNLDAKPVHRLLLKSANNLNPPQKPADQMTDKLAPTRVRFRFSQQCVDELLPTLTSSLPTTPISQNKVTTRRQTWSQAV